MESAEIAHQRVCTCDKLLQSCPAPCNPIDCSPTCSSIHEILQERILEWVAMPPPGDLPDPEIEPTSLTSPALEGGFFTISATWGASWLALMSKMMWNHGVIECHVLQVYSFHQYCLTIEEKAESWADSKLGTDQAWAAENQAEFSAYATVCDFSVYIAIPYEAI